MLSLQSDISPLSKAINKMYQGSVGKVKIPPVTGAQKSPSSCNNTTHVNVIGIPGDSQTSLPFTGTDLTDNPSDKPCCPQTLLQRVSNHTKSDPDRVAMLRLK